MSSKVTAFEAHEVQARVLVDEDVRVRALGEAIGYGNLMVLAQRFWAEDLKTKYGLDAGGAFAVYCCEAFLVPCPGCKKVESPKDCDWCCGTGRVTQKVAEAIQWLEPRPRSKARGFLRATRSGKSRHEDDSRKLPGRVFREDTVLPRLLDFRWETRRMKILDEVVLPALSCAVAAAVLALILGAL